MAKSSRAYKSSKRSRELARQKKQEEKRLRRLARHHQPASDQTLEPGAEPELEQPQETEPGDETPEGGSPETA